MIEVYVKPGICGLKSRISAHSSDMMHADLSIESDCPAILNLAREIKTVDGTKEIFAPFGMSTVFQQARLVLSHAACPVPTAVLKAVEVACGFAIPADAEIRINRSA